MAYSTLLKVVEANTDVSHPIQPAKSRIIASTYFVFLGGVGGPNLDCKDRRIPRDTEANPDGFSMPICR